MNLRFWIGFLFCLNTNLFAQNEEDALRYSELYLGGSARNVSTGGAFGAIGGDFSLVAYNPAALGRFRKHNFSFTQSLELNRVNTDFYSNNATNNAFKYTISNLSYLKSYVINPEDFSNWNCIQLGMGYNRIQDFNSNFSYSGLMDSSILHSFIRMANGINPNQIYNVLPFDAALAYDTYALDPGPNNTYVTDFTQGQTFHSRSVYQKGGMGEYNFTLSGNYANKILVGGAVNVTRLRYDMNYVHQETFTDSSIWLQDINYLYELNILGWGYGARLGLIYMPNEKFRLGLSAQSPTLFRNRDKWSANMYNNTDDGLKFVSNNNIPFGEFNYQITTPYQVNLNFGYVNKKLGSIGIDINYLDYRSSKLKSRKFDDNPYNFLIENNQIKNIYQSVLNIRLGAEYRVTESVYVRAGFVYLSSPYNSLKVSESKYSMIYSGGLGLNFGAFYLDLAFRTINKSSTYYAYDPTMLGSKVNLKSFQIGMLLTTGFRFE